MPILHWKRNQIAADEIAADRRRYFQPGVDALNRRMLYSKRPKDWTNDDIDELSYDMMNQAPDYEADSREYEVYMPNRIEPDYDDDVDRFRRMSGDIQRGTYRPPVDEYGNEYSGARDKNRNDLYVARYIDGLKPHSMRSPRVPSKVEAFLFGTNPNAGDEHKFLSPQTLAYMVPVAGEYLYGSEVAERIGEGGMPGFIETAAFAAPIAKMAARRAFRIGKGLMNAQRASDARREILGEIDRQTRARALRAPKIRRQNVRTGRWDEVNAYPEFTQYEEVR